MGIRNQDLGIREGSALKLESAPFYIRFSLHLQFPEILKNGNEGTWIFFYINGPLIFCCGPPPLIPNPQFPIPQNEMSIQYLSIIVSYSGFFVPQLVQNFP